MLAKYLIVSSRRRWEKILLLPFDDFSLVFWFKKVHFWKNKAVFRTDSNRTIEELKFLKEVYTFQNQVILIVPLRN
jgi:hypothetical protein